MKKYLKLMKPAAVFFSYDLWHFEPFYLKKGPKINAAHGSRKKMQLVGFFSSKQRLKEAC